MEEEDIRQFDKQKYLNLETYRKSGAGVKTPVWFARQGDAFYAYSLANAGKVKRIRNNPRVRIVPCDVRGNPKGRWVDGAATVLYGSDAEPGQRMLREKYGWMKRLGDLIGKIRKKQYAVLEIRLDESRR
jgi:PPOX class probable F420-dependent enzyme